jgi:hypothetical protein
MPTIAGEKYVKLASCYIKYAGGGPFDEKKENAHCSF